MTTSYVVSPELLVMGSDLHRSRMIVEREKLAARFPRFAFFVGNNGLAFATGMLWPNQANGYAVRIDTAKDYPYLMPDVTLPGTTLRVGCPHLYTGGRLCLMKYDQWQSAFSLAFVVVKTAKWLNKYERWCRTGRWPGKEQQH
jgi:hypothetical protein